MRLSALSLRSITEIFGSPPPNPPSSVPGTGLFLCMERQIKCGCFGGERYNHTLFEYFGRDRLDHTVDRALKRHSLARLSEWCASK